MNGHDFQCRDHEEDNGDLDLVEYLSAHYGSFYKHQQELTNVECDAVPDGNDENRDAANAGEIPCLKCPYGKTLPNMLRQMKEDAVLPLSLFLYYCEG